MIGSGFQNAQGSSLAAAAQWIEGLLLGSIGTSIAVLAVAGVGLAMLQGRIAARSGMRVVIGCFILFGAQTMARGLLDLAHWNAGPAVVEVERTQIPTPPSFPQPKPSANPFDPYAGASVPQ